MTEEINTSADDVNEAPEQETQETQEGATLSIQDLTTAMQVIQVTGSRGAIRADEMAVVGALYNKIFAFLDAAGAIKHEDNEGEKAIDSDAETSADEDTAAE